MLGQDGVSREMMEKLYLRSLPAVPAGCSCPVRAAGVGFPPPDIPVSHGVLGGTRPSPAMLLEAQRTKSIPAGKEY